MYMDLGFDAALEIPRLIRFYYYYTLLPIKHLRVIHLWENFIMHFFQDTRKPEFWAGHHCEDTIQQQQPESRPH